MKVEKILPGFEVEFEQRDVLGDPRRVDQRVEAAELRERRIHQGRGSAGVTEVRDDRNYSFTGKRRSVPLANAR